MPTPRRIALMADLDRADARQRAALRGVRRFAETRPHWQLAIDPFAATRPAAPYDGIIALTNAAAAATKTPPDIPVVAISHACWHRRTISRVLPNLRTAGRLAAQHLLKCGFSRYAYLGYCPDLPARLLHEGFRPTIDRAGFSFASLLFNRQSLALPIGWASLHDAIAQWLDRGVQPPAGIFVCAAPLARAVADLCRRKGLRIPDDIALITPADEPDLIEFPPPALTTIDLGYERCGHRAAQLLEQLIDAASTVPHRILLPPGDIVARRSTGVVTWHDPLVQRACCHIADHCAEPLRVADVAQALGVSLRELQRRFGHHHRRTLVGELAHARLQRAKRLLLSTSLTIGEVARRAGLTSGRRLAQLLRQADGLTPTQYRRIRPQPPDPDAPDFEKAKRLLATTGLSIGTVAHLTGYRAHRYLIDAFHVHEGTTPCAWRKRHRQRPPRGHRAPVTIIFYGPDGQPQPEDGTADERG